MNNLQEALYDARTLKKTRVVAEDQTGRWREIVSAMTVNSPLDLRVRDSVGNWFNPQQWKEVER